MFRCPEPDCPSKGGATAFHIEKEGDILTIRCWNKKCRLRIRAKILGDDDAEQEILCKPRRL